MELMQQNDTSTASSWPYTPFSTGSSDFASCRPVEISPEMSRFNSLGTNNFNLPSPLKKRIETLRKIMGLNLAEIASILSTQRSTLYNWLQSDANDVFFLDEI